jgi:predicted ferric reductase
MALVTMLAHTFCYVGSMLTPAGIAKLLQLANVMGAVGGIAMVGMAATALFLRRLHYEVFYVIHVGLYVLIIVAAGMHRPDISTDTLVIVIVTGMLWFSDRLLRAGRLLWYLRGNTVTLTPLPCGGTRVVLKRPVARAVPGKHIFLYIPSIRIAQSHPFTISAVDPITLVISGHDGFTKDLARVANANPGIEVKASMEGPYGSLVDWERYDHLVFIAGGSGASFAFGVVTDLLEKWERGTHRKISITFVWVVREQGTYDVMNFQTFFIFSFPQSSYSISSTS